jgi:hypothetical protein
MIGIWKYITVLSTGSDQLVELLLSENGLIVQSCNGQCEVVIWHREKNSRFVSLLANGAQDELKIQE